MPNKHLRGEFPRAETLFFFIHYRVLTQMHPSLVFDTVSLSFPNFYFICPLTCTPRYVRNDVIKALIIPQSMKIFLFLPISLRIIAKIFWGGVLACDLPCYFTSYHGSHPSFCHPHDLSALHSCTTPNVGPLHMLFSPTGTFFSPLPD